MMKFATLGHLMTKNDLKYIPKEWIHDDWIYSHEIDLGKTKGRITGLTLAAEEIMNLPKKEIRKKILDLALFNQNEFDIELIQLGALTTSVTSGAKWLTEQEEYKGFVNHGDSFTAAVACQAVSKALKITNKNPSEISISIIGAYGIIGEAVSKLLVPKFEKSVLIGRRENKLEELAEKIDGNFNTTTDLVTKNSDVIVTATSHPKALLKSENLKQNAIVVDVSQPPNLSFDVWKKRKDVLRIDGGFVDLPPGVNFKTPKLPSGKVFSCVAEVVMQAMEKENNNHVGSIDLNHLNKTKDWAEKYKFQLKELTNFGEKINVFS